VLFLYFQEIDGVSGQPLTNPANWQGNSIQLISRGGGTMDFFAWLTQISQSAAPPGQPFSPQWLYVIMALVIPAVVGAVLALILKIIEKTFGIRLGGGSV
jgi:hypothetical protein